ncbi:polysaccharide lyase 6 family protein [Sphingorhabdus lutea]|nr:polysaccharide lyase 6 family protein [Sphingorhabdus lutea]
MASAAVLMAGAFGDMDAYAAESALPDVGVVDVHEDAQQGDATAVKADVSKSDEAKQVYFVRNQAEYYKAAQKLIPGDVIVLANGEWRDFEIVFAGKGTKAKPIILISETPGKVIITGKSNLKIGGSHMLVTGLVFRNGYSPTGEVIAFRRTKEDVAIDSRVSEVVIDHFNQPDRYKTDYWVAMDGQRNRFDHNSLVGKSNDGVTLAVRLDLESGRKNGHRIDHNYFGPRPVLGSNGGETLRIGTSRESMFNSNTIVENNVFDRTDGEVEIISIKSGANIVRNNMFVESRGAVVLRHGDGNIIERNIFMGKGKEHSGGVRVINRNQIVRNNYMEGLNGTGFAGALTVMNGVPNSPVNRYVQVDNALIENNSIVDSARVTLAAGSDAERSAVPVNSKMQRNIIIFGETAKPIVVEDDIAGISLSDNIIFTPKPVSKFPHAMQKSILMERAANGLLYPTDPALANMGAPRDLRMMPMDEVGAKWYAKPKQGDIFGTGKNIEVADGGAALIAALDQAEEGDRLILQGANYSLDRTILIDKSLSFVGMGSGAAKPKITFNRPNLFELGEGGNLRLKDIEISGEDAPDVVGNAMIRTSATPLLANFILDIENVKVSNLIVNKAFDVIALGKGSMADKLNIKGSIFENISGKVVAADSETDDYGRYNAEYLTISNSQFNNVSGNIVALYRGGTDESTFGPHFVFEKNIINNSGHKPISGEAASIILHGVQDALVEKNKIDNSGPLKVVHTTGTPSTMILDNVFTSTPCPILVEEKAEVPPRVMMTGNIFDGKAQ